MKKTIGIISAGIFISLTSLFGQQTTKTAEDKLQIDSVFSISNTTLGGYGNALYQRDFNKGSSSINLERFVLFTGHKFNAQISFFSELEVEDAKVAGGESGGEIALEQCYLKFNLDHSHYFVAGLFLPRIGILNENHLPNIFNGNERTQVETYILPSTWRELGIGFYGIMNILPINYSVGLVNGLNAASFEHGSVIREGRFEGRNAGANSLALTGSLQLYKNNFKAQLSGYYGGGVNLSSREADSLKLSSGIFGTPVMIGEADMQYEHNGFSLRLLGSVIRIPNASDINRAYANNTPETAYGAYAELAYNLFENIKSLKEQQLTVFARYEKLDMNATLASNGITDGTLNQQHVILGLNYLPIRNVVIKADVRLVHTGNENPELIVNPGDGSLPYKRANTYLNLGIGYSF